MVYRARWQVELRFQELKSHYRLGDLPSRKRHVVEALLWASLVTLLVSRRLLEAVRAKLRAAGRRVPEARWAVIFSGVAGAILQVLLAPGRWAQRWSAWLEGMLLHESVDPNRSRQLLLSRVENGVSW